jgi:hypothetical protein
MLNWQTGCLPQSMCRKKRPVLAAIRESCGLSTIPVMVRAHLDALKVPYVDTQAPLSLMVRWRLPRNWKKIGMKPWEPKNQAPLRLM